MSREKRSPKRISNLVFKAITDILENKNGITKKLIRETCLEYDVNEKHVKTIMEY